MKHHTKSLLVTVDETGKRSLVRPGAEVEMSTEEAERLNRNAPGSSPLVEALKAERVQRTEVEGAKQAEASASPSPKRVKKE